MSNQLPRWLCAPTWFMLVGIFNLPALAQETSFGATEQHIGPAGANEYLVPDNHRLTPAGKLLDFPGARPQALALSMDDRLLAVGGGSVLSLVDAATGDLLDRASVPILPGESSKPVSDHQLKPDKPGQLSFTGLAFSPDGKRVFLSDVAGGICVFSVNEANKLRVEQAFRLPDSKNSQRSAEIPAGLAVSPDGARLYVALNLSNQLAELDAEKLTVLRQWEVGMLPYGVQIVGERVYVSNWAGRRPEKDDPVAEAGRGVDVRIDPRTGAAVDGSVSVVDLKQGAVVREIVVGRHASGMAVSPDKKYLCVANAASDFVSVIDLAELKVVERIFPKQTPADLFGASPNALTFAADGKTLFVCNGTQNAVAVVEFSPGHSQLNGLIPTGWYPGAIELDRTHRQLCMANIKGYGSGPGRTRPAKPGDEKGGKETGEKYASKQYQGSVSLIPLPADRAELRTHTATVLKNHRAPLIELAQAKPRADAKPRAVPLRVGEPSLFQHVVYIIKENRTYDQVLGDLPQGNGDPSLCTFGEEVTPNLHRLAKQFVLLDNTYCSGVLSADGHNWACSAMTTDYLEKSFAGFPRSYPDGLEAKGSDAMAWSPAGFIWDAALAQKKTVRLLGPLSATAVSWSEAARKSGRTGSPGWTEIWTDFLNRGGEVQVHTRPLIEKIHPYICEEFPGWATNVSDQQRIAVFGEQLTGWEKTGQMPNLIVMTLPSDHTSGTSEGYPQPQSMVADNDLAVGKIVEMLSASRFWAQTCLFAIEDDPQAGWDHVSGYRTTAYVVSPYTRRGAVVHTQYNQTSVLRTIELILGLPPMNELDAIATPMFDCFTDTADLTRYRAEPARIALDKLNPSPLSLRDGPQRRWALESAKLDFSHADACPEDTLNRILWHSIKGNAPYLDWAIHPDDE